MRLPLILLAVLAVISLSCGNSDREAEARFAQMEANGIAKVKVGGSGDIYLNGKLTSLDALGDEFARIQKVNGVVWYYRTAQSQAAEAAGLEVMKKVVEYKLPVKMCDSNDPCSQAFE